MMPGRSRSHSGHWPEYLIEAGALGTFMISACAFGTLIGYTGSPVHRLLPEPWIQRAVMGVLMGLTAIGIIYSPWGKRSGAHMNPALTLTFLRLGKVAPHDTAAYLAAQFVGGAMGVLLARLLVGMALDDPSVRYVVTQPGPFGVAAAFAAELAISAVLMTVVLESAASRRWSRYTGVLAGLLVAIYITLEAPISGMSMNPARTLASAVAAQEWTALWVYFTAPLAGMLLAAQVYLWRRGHRAVPCAKMRHVEGATCLFCEYWRPRELHPSAPAAVTAPAAGYKGAPNPIARSAFPD
jgi:aquaporin Z